MMWTRLVFGYGFLVFCLIFTQAQGASAQTAPHFTMESLAGPLAQCQYPRGLHIHWNTRVQKYLNKYVRWQGSRSHAKQTLGRLQKIEAQIVPPLQEANLPRELLGIPFIESGFQNITSPPSAYPAAGIWQFIAPTARNYKLRVDSSIDERLNVRAQTLAAIRYLKDFKDWQLVVLAYNMGAHSVKKAIKRTSEHDAWKLTARGFENDPDYLAKFNAAALIIRYPELADGKVPDTSTCVVPMDKKLRKRHPIKSRYK